jgi:hypothetical protein
MIYVEAQARQAFLATLVADVVQPLTSLKVYTLNIGSHHLVDSDNHRNPKIGLVNESKKI